MNMRTRCFRSFDRKHRVFRIDEKSLKAIAYGQTPYAPCFNRKYIYMTKHNKSPLLVFSFRVPSISTTISSTVLCLIVGYASIYLTILLRLHVFLITDYDREEFHPKCSLRAALIIMPITVNTNCKSV